MGKNKDVRDAVEDELNFVPLVNASDTQYVEAAAARRVAGVKNVHNHLEVVLPPGDYRDDPTLTTTANNALAQNITVPAGVEASARNGRVTLTGTVRYGSERAAAEQTIAGLAGVRNIKNEIEIRSGAERLDVTLNVQDALNRYALIPDGSDVTVETSGNTVTLSGHVRTWAERDAVVGAAWLTVDVYDVRDELLVIG
jgi:osmotically-inducible protein OsmY